MLRGNRSLNNSMSWMHSGLAPAQNALMGFGWASVRADGWGKLVSVPSGYPAPTNGLYPAITGGAMSSYKKGQITVSASSYGAMGLCRTAAGAALLDASAIGGLVAGGVANGSITLDASADIFALLAGVADGLATLSGSADIAAIGHAGASGTATLAGTVEPYALGFMVATTVVPSEIPTVAEIAAGVWQQILGGVISAEDAMLAAGSAGDPWITPLPGSYADGTAGAIIATIQSILRNRTKTDPLTGQMTVYADDGVTPLMTANLWEDTAGTTPYRGKGAELRERLE